MVNRRAMLVASIVCSPAMHALAKQAPDASADIDSLGKFEVVRGRPGIVIGAPHGTPDAGTLDAARHLCETLGCSGVFVTGGWDAKVRQRININRPTEQLIGPHSEILREWSSERAIALNQRYDERVKEASQGPLKAFYEIHSNHMPKYADSVQVSTLGVSRGDAARFKAAFEAARDRLSPDVPKLAVHVSPADKVSWPNYHNATTISRLAQKGCAIEHPARVFENKAWRHAYADCLAQAIANAPWS